MLIVLCSCIRKLDTLFYLVKCPRLYSSFRIKSAYIHPQSVQKWLKKILNNSIWQLNSFFSILKGAELTVRTNILVWVHVGRTYRPKVSFIFNQLWNRLLLRLLTLTIRRWTSFFVHLIIDAFVFAEYGLASFREKFVHFKKGLSLDK